MPLFLLNPANLRFVWPNQVQIFQQSTTASPISIGEGLLAGEAGELGDCMCLARSTLVGDYPSAST